jgi:hypothetical protein
VAEAEALIKHFAGRRDVLAGNAVETHHLFLSCLRKVKGQGGQRAHAMIVAVERGLHAPDFECLASADNQNGVADPRPSTQQVWKDAAAFGIDRDRLQQAKDAACPGMAGARPRRFLGEAAAAAFKLELQSLGGIVGDETGVDFVTPEIDRCRVRAETQWYTDERRQGHCALRVYLAKRAAHE